MNLRVIEQYRRQELKKAQFTTRAPATKQQSTNHVPYSTWPGGIAVRGTWHGGKKSDGTRTALMACPACGKIASLGDHEIDVDGNVNPSVVCPLGCAYHEWVTLDGWNVPGAEDAAADPACPRARRASGGIAQIRSDQLASARCEVAGDRRLRGGRTRWA